MEQRLFLRKNQSSNPKAPEYKLSLMPAEKGGEWVDVCGLWLSESGKGWSGRVEDAVEITVKSAEQRPPRESRSEPAPQYRADAPEIAYPDDEINPADIPF